MRKLFTRFVRSDDGQDLIEYAFLTILLALIVTVALGTIGSHLTSTFNRATTQVAQGDSSTGGTTTAAAGSAGSPDSGGAPQGRGRGRGH